MKYLNLCIFLIIFGGYNCYGQVDYNTTIIEDFERDTTWIWAPWQDCTLPKSSLSRGAAHSGNLGLNCLDDCFRRTDISIGYPKQVISCWVRFQRKTNAYLGFGIDSIENENAYFLCVAPEKNTLDFRRSPDYTYPFLKSVSTNYKMNVWYFVELTYNTKTNVTGKLYASNGKTLLNSLTIELPDLSPGGVSFKGHFLHVDELSAGTKRMVSETSFHPKFGTPVVLKNVLFETNKSVLLDESFKELNSLLVYLKSNPTNKITIVGHTDNSGNEAENKKLSEERAKAVANYLINGGISKANISCIGFGSLNPITTNDTEEGRRKNRRVEITIKTN